MISFIEAQLASSYSSCFRFVVTVVVDDAIESGSRRAPISIDPISTQFDLLIRHLGSML